MNWLKENWIWVLPIAVGVLSAINHVTIKWNEVQGPWWRRLLLVLPLFLLDLASVLRSKGSTSLTKLPLTLDLEPKTKPFDPGSKLPLLLPLAFLVSCGGWQKNTLQTTFTVQKGVTAAHAGLKQACKPQVKKCKAEGRIDLKTCPELQACFDVRSDVLKGLDITMRGVLLTLTAVEIGDKKLSMESIARVLKDWGIVVGGLKTLGISPEGGKRAKVPKEAPGG